MCDKRKDARAPGTSAWVSRGRGPQERLRGAGVPARMQLAVPPNHERIRAEGVGARGPGRNPLDVKDARRAAVNQRHAGCS